LVAFQVIILNSITVNADSQINFKILNLIDGVTDVMARNTGFYIAITNNSVLPLINYEGLHIPLGQQTNIGIVRNFINKLPYPYSNCRDSVTTSLSSDSEYYKITSDLSRYTRNLCFDICLQYKYIIPNCNCADVSITSNINNVSLCLTVEKNSCVKAQKDNFISNSVNCEQYCPETCERIEYIARVSTSNYPSE